MVPAIPCLSPMRMGNLGFSAATTSKYKCPCLPALPAQDWPFSPPRNALEHQKIVSTTSKRTFLLPSTHFVGHRLDIHTHTPKPLIWQTPFCHFLPPSPPANSSFLTTCTHPPITPLPQTGREFVFLPHTGEDKPTTHVSVCFQESWRLPNSSASLRFLSRCKLGKNRPAEKQARLLSPRPWDSRATGYF